MPKITKRLVDAAEPRDKPYTIYDGQVPGFGIRVQPGGTRTYVVLYRFARHRRCVSLGHPGMVAPEQARTQAIRILMRVKDGEDPAASRQGGGHMITVADLSKRFDEEHIAVRLKTTHGQGISTQPSTLHRAGVGTAQGGRGDPGRRRPPPP